MFWKEKNERKEKEIFRRNMRRNNQFTNEMKISRTIFVSRLFFIIKEKGKEIEREREKQEKRIEEQNGENMLCLTRNYNE